jgi:hypothetical protein
MQNEKFHIPVSCFNAINLFAYPQSFHDDVTTVHSKDRPLRRKWFNSYQIAKQMKCFHHKSTDIIPGNSDKNMFQKSKLERKKACISCPWFCKAEEKRVEDRQKISLLIQ